MHIVQTASCHSLADTFVDNFSSNEKSIADAIVDQTALRKETLIPLIKKTGGNGWIALNDEIKTAQEMAKKHARLSISPNSALSIVGLMQAIYTGKSWDGTVACMICGD